LATPIIGVGAGGHAKVVIEILRSLGTYDLVGLLDANEERWQTEVLGVPVLGNDSKLEHLFAEGIRTAFIGLGTTKDPGGRIKLYSKVREIGYEIAPAIHPDAIVSGSARIGVGPTIMATAVVNADATIGDNVIVNTGAIVEHDCVLQNHVHVATRACLAGSVRVGQGSFIGAGAVIKHGIDIGSYVIVAAGAVVINNIPDGAVVMGVPARIRS